MTFLAIDVGYDDVLYAYRKLYGGLVRSTDRGASFETSEQYIDTDTYGLVKRLFATGTGWVAFTADTTDGSEFGTIWWCPAFGDPWQHVLTTDAAGAYFQRLSCTSYYDPEADLDIVCGGEYGRRDDASKNLWLSLDGGQTFSSVRMTPLNTSDGTNSHWHTARYDPHSGLLWASAGDGANMAIDMSEDLGVSWRRNSESWQPTGIAPLPRRVAFGRDSGDAGAFHYNRDAFHSPPAVDAFTLDPVVPAFEQYGINGPVSGEVAYMSYKRQGGDTHPHMIWATGDGGVTWHNVWESDTEQPPRSLTGPDSEDWIYGITANSDLLRSAAVQWTA